MNIDLSRVSLEIERDASMAKIVAFLCSSLFSFTFGPTSSKVDDTKRKSPLTQRQAVARIAACILTLTTHPHSPFLPPLLYSHASMLHSLLPLAPTTIPTNCLRTVDFSVVLGVMLPFQRELFNCMMVQSLDRQVCEIIVRNVGYNPCLLPLLDVMTLQQDRKELVERSTVSMQLLNNIERWKPGMGLDTLLMSIRSLGRIDGGGCCSHFYTPHLSRDIEAINDMSDVMTKEAEAVWLETLFAVHTPVPFHNLYRAQILRSLSPTLDVAKLREAEVVVMFLVRFGIWDFYEEVCGLLGIVLELFRRPSDRLAWKANEKLLLGLKKVSGRALTFLIESGRVPFENVVEILGGLGRVEEAGKREEIAVLCLRAGVLEEWEMMDGI